MNEIKNLLEIELRERNAKALAVAIELAGEALLNEIDFSNEKSDYQIVRELELSDREGNSLECELLVIFLKEYRLDGNTRKRELGIITAPKGKLKREVYKQNLSAFQMTDEITLRTWKLLTRSKSEGISIHGRLETATKFEGLGLGLTILIKGEEVKNQISYRLANFLGKRTIETSVTDGSENGWTTRNIHKLPGYILDTSVSEGKSFKKTEIAPFI